MCTASILGVQSYEDIVEFEVKRQGAITGHDADDVKQEMRVVVAGCLPRIETNKNTGRTYVRRSVRNALANLKRAATSAIRCPRDPRGKTLPVIGVEDVASLVPCSTPDPEREAETRELIRVLEERMTIEDRVLLYEAFIDGVLHRRTKRMEKVRKRAESILTNFLKPVDQTRGETMTKTRQLPGPPVPECHSKGTDPVGYETDPEDAEDCQNCDDKDSCLSDGITEGLIDADLGIDREIKARYHGIITKDEFLARLAERQKLRAAGKDVPEKIAYDNLGDLNDKLDSLSDELMVRKAGETMADDDNNNEEGEVKPKAKKKTKPESGLPKAKKKKAAPKSEDAPKAKKKAAPKSEDAPKKAKKKKAKDEPKAPPPKKVKGKKTKAKAEAKPKKGKKKAKDESKAKKGATKRPTQGFANRNGEKGFFRYEGEPEELADGRIELPNGRFIPAPKDLTKEQMTLALGRVNSKLGLDFDLKVGMKLIQERRSGDNVVITLRKNGFHVASTDNIYSSLSAACMAALVRQVSGVEMFNFEKHSNIAAKGKGVPGGTYRKGDAE